MSVRGCGVQECVCVGGGAIECLGTWVTIAVEYSRHVLDETGVVCVTQGTRVSTIIASFQFHIALIILIMYYVQHVQQCNKHKKCIGCFG